ncbi:transcriptional activator haa1 [Neocucurbitaria cava]|uniref:Transcriptional activator haa1 n=1 Tax=Neocucurbitaria cava TaxID=798079 RepID=A0A9W8YB28_9PLEO|nr:transcriptional activator haa1 [Neocucurbitaria cava]
MPVIDGAKWACSSCIKGHRVSGCTHNDRELHHINPKGRPVKQCEHCRGARKSKSHHAKCDCGDKKDKDKHKDKGDAKGMTTTGTADLDESNDALAHDGGCQCHSGAKCICGTIKEELKVDTSRQTLHDARAKPKLMTTHSESHLTVFANGHHKPCHRNNNTAHVSGAPYKIPRPHTLHGHSAFAALSQSNNSYSKPEVPATRSMDTLSLSNNDFYAMFGSTPRSVDNMPITNMANSVDTLPFQDALFTSQSSVFGQDGQSPDSNSDTFSSQQWPWTTTTATPINGTFGFGSLSTSPSQDCLPNLDNDWSIPSAGFNPLWSAGDLPLDPSKFSDSLTQPISHSGESKQSGPGLTAASSAHSEIGDPNIFGDVEYKPPQSAASESLFWEDSPVYRFNTSAPSENIAAPVTLPASTSMPNIPELEPTFAKSLSAAPTTMTSTASNDYTETAAIAMPTNYEDVVPIDPWPLDQNNGAFGALNNFELSYSNNWF